MALLSSFKVGRDAFYPESLRERLRNFPVLAEVAEKTEAGRFDGERGVPRVRPRPRLHVALRAVEMEEHGGVAISYQLSAISRLSVVSNS